MVSFDPRPVLLKRINKQSKSYSSNRLVRTALHSTGYTSQGILTCPSQSAGFDLTGPEDFLSAQSHRELRLFLNIHDMIIRQASYKRLLQDTLKIIK